MSIVSKILPNDCSQIFLSSVLKVESHFCKVFVAEVDTTVGGCDSNNKEVNAEFSFVSHLTMIKWMQWLLSRTIYTLYTQ